MSLKPQDVLIVLKLQVTEERRWSYSSLSAGLFISISEVHAGVQRAVASHLLDPNRKLPIVQSVEELMIFGLRYMFPVQLGGLVRGMPTGYGGPPLRCRNLPKDLPTPVWEVDGGEVLGYDCPPSILLLLLLLNQTPPSTNYSHLQT